MYTPTWCTHGTPTRSHNIHKENVSYGPCFKPRKNSNQPHIYQMSILLLISDILSCCCSIIGMSNGASPFGIVWCSVPIEYRVSLFIYLLLIYIKQYIHTNVHSYDIVTYFGASRRILTFLLFG